jgi:hypothetical protein
MFWFHQSLGFSTRTVESTFSNPDHGDQIIKPFVIFSMGCQGGVSRAKDSPISAPWDGFAVAKEFAEKGA